MWADNPIIRQNSLFQTKKALVEVQTLIPRSVETAIIVLELFVSDGKSGQDVVFSRFRGESLVELLSQKPLKEPK